MKREKKEKFVNYYDLLGVSSAASFDEIKRAYRRIAREQHPDRGGSKELFVLATKAKKTLLDEASRLEYNRKLALSCVDVHAIYEDKIPTKRKSEDYHVRLEANLRDVMNGAAKEISITPRTPCEDCSGLGSTDGNFYDCDMCKGHGLLCTSFDSPTGKVEASGDCFDCHGIGQLRDRKGSQCDTCSGIGIVQTEIKLNVALPPGFATFGYKQSIPDRGHCRVNGLPGDVVVEVYLSSNDIVVEGNSFTFGTPPTAEPCEVRLQRRSEEQNIMVDQDISLRQALMGFSIRFRHLDGTMLDLTPIKMGTVTQNKHGRVLRGGGFPRSSVDGERGTLSVHYNVILPQDEFLDGIRRQEINEILLSGKSKAILKKNKEEEEEEEEEEEVRPTKKRKNGNDKEVTNDGRCITS